MTGDFSDVAPSTKTCCVRPPRIHVPDPIFHSGRASLGVSDAGRDRGLRGSQGYLPSRIYCLSKFMSETE